MNEFIRYSLAALFTISGISGSTYLLLKNKIKQPAYCFMLILSVFIGMWVGYSERVKELSVGLGKMTMVLSEMQETQRDVQKREENIKKLAILMGDLITFVQATKAGIEVTSEVENEWLRVKLDTLSSLSGEKIDNPFSRLAQKRFGPNLIEDEQWSKILLDYQKDVEIELQKIKTYGEHRTSQ